MGGVKIHYVESGDVNKPLILFLHGWPQFWFAWRNQIEHFNKDYHVVAMDSAMLDNLIACNMPHPVAFNEARKSIEQALKSWYIVFFQVPLLPEINMMLDDIKIFDPLFKDNPN